MFPLCSHDVKGNNPAPADDLHNPSREVRTARAGRIPGSPKAGAGNQNNIRHLMPIRRGVGRMGLVESLRPVVLVVEDEWLLRMDAANVIAAAGFEVVEAANADAAIEILETRRDITVVFTDIQMPGSMDGLKLARAVRGRWPPIKIVATSGHVQFSETDLPEGGRFLPKPYSPVQVTDMLRELTGGR